MVVKIDYGAYRRKNHNVVVRLTPTKSHKPVRLPDDSELLAYFVKKLAADGNSEVIDPTTWLAANRILRRGRHGKRY